MPRPVVQSVDIDPNLTSWKGQSSKNHGLFSLDFKNSHLLDIELIFQIYGLILS